jgi:curved DNA-binding protein CbpA
MCTPHEVRDAAERLFAELDPARFAGMKDETLPDKLEEILRVVADAREVLADERLREEYLQGLGGA